MQLLPDPKNTAHVAHIELTPGDARPSELYDAILNRHTNRFGYDAARPVLPETLAAVTALNGDPDVGVLWFTTPEQRHRVGERIVATEALVADAEQMRDSDAWLRLGSDQLKTHRPGITVDAQGASSRSSRCCRTRR